MRMFVVMVIVLLAVGSGVAAEQQTDKPSGDASLASEVAPTVKPAPKPPSGKKSLTWPRPHQPSEEISADSIVPFPVDI